MRKLSIAQTNALWSVHTNGVTGPGTKVSTENSLQANGLVTDENGRWEVTESGHAEYLRATGEPLSATAPEDAREGTSITSDGAQAAQEAPSVLAPVFQEPRSNTIYGQRPVQVVQADRDHLVRTYGETRADEILDTWETVANRADRRNGHRKARAEGRREMRLRRTPSRRRFTTQAALIRKAERRAAKIQAA